MLDNSEYSVIFNKMPPSEINRVMLRERIWHYYQQAKSAEGATNLICRESEVGALYDAGPSGTQQIVNKHGMSGSTVSTVSTVSYHVKAIEEETGRQVSGTTSQLEALPDTTPHQTPPVLTENFGISEATAWYHVKAIEENREKETQEYIDVCTTSDTDNNEDNNALGAART
ncbi:hypothetical protein DMN91_007079 [Ooceraea biroi]|uniref:Uncharacterized protein n=1 Tax=Ooceraea biroi TaxID=2015173 RepID=A0A3L8DKN6_OOCBI|nr:hypothetical protein DMN91_007079 [Ooceraea biroi]